MFGLLTAHLLRNSESQNIAIHEVKREMLNKLRKQVPKRTVSDPTGIAPHGICISGGCWTGKSFKWSKEESKAKDLNDSKVKITHCQFELVKSSPGKHRKEGHKGFCSEASWSKDVFAALINAMPRWQIVTDLSRRTKKTQKQNTTASLPKKQQKKKPVSADLCHK